MNPISRDWSHKQFAGIYPLLDSGRLVDFANLVVIDLGTGHGGRFAATLRTRFWSSPMPGRIRHE